MKCIALILVLVLVAAVLFTGCTSSDESGQQQSTTTPRATAVTTVRPSSPVKITVHSIENYFSDNQFSQPGAGYKFILVDFSITNIGLPNGYSYSPYDIKVRDPDNYEYEYNARSYSVPGCFDGSVISQGQTRRGKLVFEVPIAPAGTLYTVIVSP